MHRCFYFKKYILNWTNSSICWI